MKTFLDALAFGLWISLSGFYFGIWGVIGLAAFSAGSALTWLLLQARQLWR
jgi:hypothetical protein